MTIRKNGFTLIELVVTLVILAVLAVVAAPRFLNLQSDARQSMLSGVAAEFQQAINFAHYQWVVNGRGNQEIANLSGYGQDKLDINHLGYPLGTDKNTRMSAPYNIGKGNEGCVAIWETLMDTSLKVTTNGNEKDSFDFYARRETVETVTKSGGTTNAFAMCSYIYTQDGFNTDPANAAHLITYDSRNGLVTYTYQG